MVVSYGPNHHPDKEWVYNESDIDNARVVWARALDTTEDRKLIDYFSNRQAWLLEADSKPPRLSPYKDSSGVAVGSGNSK